MKIGLELIYPLRLSSLWGPAPKETIRNRLSSHFRVTTSMKRSDGKMLFIRKTAKPEDCHIKIYDALNLSHRPGKTSMIIL
jgi:hypothetical protein